MTSDRPRCSEEALDRGEELYATASLVSAWLLIEQSGAWGPDALTDSGFPAEIARELQRRAAGVRILLIRHREPSDEGPRMFKAVSGGDRSPLSLVSSSMPDPSVLLDIDFESLAGGDVGPGSVVDHPLYLVCTHGRHDICCADKGRPLYRALSEFRPESTWEVSHLGGDRFAGNLLILPRGDYFGRVEADGAERLVAAYEAGRLDLRHHRGRSILPRLVQAAEHFVREAEGLVGLDDLTMTEFNRPEHDRAEVVFSVPSGSITVEVEAREDAEPAFLTCRADDMGQPVSYNVVSMARV